RKAAREPRRAAPRAEFLEPRDIEVRKETTASLIARVEHRALEPERGQFRKKENEVRLFIGEQYADQGDFARRKHQRIAETFERRTVHCELEVVHADRRERSRSRKKRFVMVRRIAERRACLASPRDGSNQFARGLEGD